MGTTAHPSVERMSRADLERELLTLRVVRNGGARARDLERANERVKQLELRDQERARELLKARANLKAMERQLAEARREKDDADRNARQWHALLLQEKVRKL